jgi:uncharacterized membrane protein (DUF485 family)
VHYLFVLHLFVALYLLHYCLCIILFELVILHILFASFTPEQMKTKGNCNGHDVTVNALGFILFGHALHHLHVLKERYDV